ncbi:MAG: NAD(P)H-hydrate epimerase [Phycisphaerales bacterium]|nr:NAD(P)H-hydrate epimerase [Phycisphaerales bacterium]
MNGQDHHTSPPNPFAAREPINRGSEPSTGPAPSYPIYEMDAESCRVLDAICINEFKIPGIVLMENAGAALCRNAIEMLNEFHASRVEIFCGPGNNAGDGFVLARHLHNHQIDVRIHLLIAVDQYTNDARTNMKIVLKMGIACKPFETALVSSAPGALIVDAIFGTGLSRPPSGTSSEMIEAINTMRQQGAKVLAVDVPSGFDAQSGQPMSACVIADRTVTLAALKSGFTALRAQPMLGHLVVEDIGVPLEVLERLGTRVHPPSTGNTL